MKIIFLGAPGAGKGTQSDKVSVRIGVPTISTGVIIREAIKLGTQMGLEAKKFIDAGELCPDDVVIEIIKERLSILYAKTPITLRFHRLRHTRIGSSWPSRP